MDTLKPVDYINVKCIGCGTNLIVQFLLAKYVVSAPEIACSYECLRCYEVSIEAYLERQPRGE